jgi:hypothetical protein
MSKQEIPMNQLISIDDADLEYVSGGLTISGSVTLPTVKDILAPVVGFGEAVGSDIANLAKGFAGLFGLSVHVGR